MVIVLDSEKVFGKYLTSHHDTSPGETRDTRNRAQHN